MSSARSAGQTVQGSKRKRESAPVVRCGGLSASGGRAGLTLGLPRRRVVGMATTHKQCRDAECNICRGDTHVIGSTRTDDFQRLPCGCPIDSGCDGYHAILP